MFSFSYFFFITLTDVKVSLNSVLFTGGNVPSLDIWPDDIQPSGNAATIWRINYVSSRKRKSMAKPFGKEPSSNLAR